METNLLLTILVIFMIILLILIFFLISRLYSSKNQVTFTSLKNQLDDQYQNDKSLLLKSQETATTLLALQQQFQTLSQEFHILNKGSFRNSATIDAISKDLNDIQKVMINKKTRGNWGEYQLEMLLSLYVGDHKGVFESQYVLESGAIADVALHLPDDERLLLLDSKFPMENYQKMIEHQGNRAMEERYLQLFKTNIKKHISDIANKYITQQTMETAIMFIPSEAIYTFICGSCPELIDEAYKKHVLITSPTTLVGVVFTLINITKEFHRAKHIQEIEQELNYLFEDTARLVERANKASQYASLTLKHIDEMQISIQKLTKRMQQINEGQIE